MIRVAIIGAGGYTGVESIEIILRHPEVKLTYLTAQQEFGNVADIYPQLSGRCDMMIEPLDLGKLAKLADVALCCLPHKVSMSVVPQLLSAGVKVVDFSADYRIKDLVLYEKYYEPHTDKEILPMRSMVCRSYLERKSKGRSWSPIPAVFQREQVWPWRRC